MYVDTGQVEQVQSCSDGSDGDSDGRVAEGEGSDDGAVEGTSTAELFDEYSFPDFMDCPQMEYLTTPQHNLHIPSTILTTTSGDQPSSSPTNEILAGSGPLFGVVSFSLAALCSDTPPIMGADTNCLSDIPPGKSH